MISNTQQRSLATSSDLQSANFGISREDEVHVLTMLRDTLYSDKPLAVLREYSANAWDAHREVGKDDVAIEVTLPTATELTLHIRDHGPGISHDDMLGRFLKAGASTKRGSNNTVGTLGIGRLAGFAYSDSFTVVSRHGGRRRTYVAVLDTSERGQLKVLGDEACDETDTGLEVQIAISPRDVDDFIAKARALYTHFTPRPCVNTALPTEMPRLATGALSPSSTGWIAVMGCVPYPVDLGQLHVADFVRHLGGVLYFEIGDLHVAASREALKYSDETKVRLQQKLEAFLDEYVTAELAALAQPDLSSWERRLRAQPLRRFKLSLVDAARSQGLLAGRVDLPAKAAHYEVTLSYSGGAKYEGVAVARHSRIFVRDDRRALSGYSLHPSDYVVRPRTKGLKREEMPAIVALAEAELTTALAACGLTGIEVVRTSALKWFKEGKLAAVEPVGPRSPKHRAKMFAYKGTSGYPLSQNWSLVEREPNENDLYVEIAGFDSGDFYVNFRRNKKILEAFGLTVPIVYGYKRSCKAKRVGQSYDNWSTALAHRLVIECAELADLVEHAKWAAVLDDDHRHTLSDDALLKIETQLGSDHVVTSLLRRAKRGLDALKSTSSAKKWSAKAVLELLAEKTSAAQAARDAVLKTYPLLKAHSQEIAALWDSNHAQLWIDYVKEKTPCNR